MRGFILNQRPVDRRIISDYVESFSKKNNSDLIKSYNKAYEQGFFGVHRQALSLVELHEAFIRRFGKSPFLAKSEHAYEFTTPIILKGNNWEPSPTPNPKKMIQDNKKHRESMRNKTTEKPLDSAQSEDHTRLPRTREYKTKYSTVNVAELLDDEFDGIFITPLHTQQNTLLNKEGVRDKYLLGLEMFRWTTTNEDVPVFLYATYCHGGLMVLCNASKIYIIDKKFLDQNHGSNWSRLDS